MTTADRVDPDINRAWKQALVPVGTQAWPGADAASNYRGKHRRHSQARLTLHRLFYRAKHRHR